MTIQKELGAKGEHLAQDFLRDAGYEILEANWRYRRAEVDIIARHQGILIFVEVKTRSYDHFGAPESFVGRHKQQMLTAAAHAYMDKIGHEWEVRFDVISILWRKGGTPSLRHVEDAFFRGLED